MDPMVHHWPRAKYCPLPPSPEPRSP
jgi:hypothetical protein